MEHHDCGPNFSRLYDVHGIYCCRICDVCEAEKRARFRPEIFTDPDYERSEDIDAD